MRTAFRVLSVAFVLISPSLVTMTCCSGDDVSVSAIARQLGGAQKTRIVCFGDSITGAYYHTGGERAWCDMLGFALAKTIPRANIEMINAGLSGHTTVNALARIQQDVLDKQPDLVVVMFGMNDVTRVSLSDFRANLETIAQRCRENGSAVVLCTPNSVIENTARPNHKLAEFSKVVRDVAIHQNVPVIDIFQYWQRLREQDPKSWILTMSDSIHPNMNGHKHFANLIARTITGKAMTVDDVGPLSAALHHTFDRAHAGEPVKLVAMPPYDDLFPALLRDHFPDAQFDVVRWPTEDQSIEQLAEWAKQIRAMKPDLVVPAVPAGISAADTKAFVGHYEWVLNWSFQFSGRSIRAACGPKAVAPEQW